MSKDYGSITEQKKQKVLQHCRVMRYHGRNAKIIIDECIEQVKLDNRKLSWWDRVDNNHVPGQFNLGGLHG
jgi:hypothetical protein